MNVCRILALAVALLSAQLVTGQTIAPARVQWQKTYGGDHRDRQPCLARAWDGGYFLGGKSWSGVSGNKATTNYGDSDFWVLRLDSAGNKIWEGDFGTEGSEEMWAIQGTSDDGCVLMGETWSPGPHYWVVRLDADGQKLWERQFGGTSGGDFGRTVLQTSDGGFLIGGYSHSPVSGDKTAPNLGNGDFWVIRLDAQGNKLWDKTYGGSDRDWLAATCKTLDGGFVLLGYSWSGRSGNKSSGNYGGDDVWLVRIDGDG